jgi:ComF family protein
MDWLSWIFPRRCLGCNEVGSYLCPDCVNRLAPLYELYCPYCRRPSVMGITHPKCKTHCDLDGLVSCCTYGGIMAKAITKFKYSFVHDLTNTLIELFISLANQPVLMNRTWTIIPVPLHPSRQNWRGFNQAGLLAKGLAANWQRPLDIISLHRCKNTSQQMSLSGKQRRSNLRHAFSVSFSHHPPNSVLLIDDVATTGSTLVECAAVLKKAGVKEVWGLTLAQKVPHW